MSSPQPTAPTSFSQGYTPNPSRPTRKEILNYSAPWPVYGLDWSNQPTEREALRLAVGSFIEDGSNKVSENKGCRKTGHIHEFLMNRAHENAGLSFTTTCFLIAYRCLSFIPHRFKSLHCPSSLALRAWTIPLHPCQTGFPSQRPTTNIQSQR